MDVDHVWRRFNEERLETMPRGRARKASEAAEVLRAWHRFAQERGVHAADASEILGNLMPEQRVRLPGGRPVRVVHRRTAWQGQGLVRLKADLP